MKLLRRLILALLPAFAGTAALAHGPTPQQAEHRIEIAAAPAQVWAILGNPASYADWHPDIAALAAEGEGAGSKRRIEFASGGGVTEGIDRIDAEKMEIRWRLSQEDIESFPTSYYTNSIRVEPDGEAAAVVWSASFFRADTTNEPQERFSDEAAVAAMDALITHGLEGLKAAAEK